jgi:hypothetical protein
VLKLRNPLICLLFMWNFLHSATLGAMARAQIDNKEVTDIVNPQTLITARHGLLLVVSSWFTRALLAFFLQISRIFRVFGAALTCRNLPYSATTRAIVVTRGENRPS